MIMGPGGEYYGEHDPREAKLQKDMLDALTTDYNVSMDFFKIPGSQRESFNSGGNVSGIHIKRPGLLHAELGIPEGEKIPLKRLQSAERRADKTDDSRLKKQVVFAENARKWKK